MSTTPETQHEVILGRKPTPKQCMLYSNYPRYCGFSDRSKSDEILEAVVLLALTMDKKADRVYLLAPVQYEDWVLEKFNSVADTIFGGCKKHPKGVALAKFYASLFKRIGIFGRLLQLTEEPRHWVSFGFAVDDPLPAWMRERLLQIEASSVSLRK
jgi:hypothetical protein